MVAPKLFESLLYHALLESFYTLAEIREQTDKWLKEYNKARLHEASYNTMPSEFR